MLKKSRILWVHAGAVCVCGGGTRQRRGGESGSTDGHWSVASDPRESPFEKTKGFRIKFDAFTTLLGKNVGRLWDVDVHPIGQPLLASAHIHPQHPTGASHPHARTHRL